GSGASCCALAQTFERLPIAALAPKLHDALVRAELPTHLPARPQTRIGDDPAYAIDAPTNGNTPSVARTQRTSPCRLTDASYAARIPVSNTPRFCVTPAKESDWPRQ